VDPTWQSLPQPGHFLSVSVPWSTMPQGNGLGYVSADVKDLYRKLESPLALKDGFELKPPYQVPKYSAVNGEENAPCGCLYIKIRLADEELSITDIAKGAYMKYAIAETIGETIMALAGVYASGGMVSLCMDEVKVLDAQFPFSGSQVWQFCDFRFDYKISMPPQDGKQAAYAIYSDMTNFETAFCQTLEMKFRNIYHLTVLGLTNKQYALMDGVEWAGMAQLYKAAQENDTGSITSLLGKVDVNASPKEAGYCTGGLDEEFKMEFVELGRTALLGAAEAGSVEAMRLLLDKKANVDFQDNAGFSALYLAAGSANAEKAVTALLGWGPSMSLKTKQGFTPLHNACGAGESGAIKALIEAKADLNAKSKGGSAPIHVAVLNDEPGVLDTLKALKANLDMPAFGGNTPVHEAVMQNNVDMIQKLFELKADINIESGPEHKFSTPLKMALDRKRKKAAAKLQELGALEKIEGIEYEDSTDGEFEPTGDGEYKPVIKGRYYS